MKFQLMTSYFFISRPGIQSLRDENGAIFIDRDPDLFSKILNYLRTKDIDIVNQCSDLKMLRHESEYYNIHPLTKRLLLCEEMDHSGCGDLLFYCLLPPPNIPIQEYSSTSLQSSSSSNGNEVGLEPGTSTYPRPGSMIRVPEAMPSTSGISNPVNPSSSRHSRNSSWDMRVSYNSNRNWVPGHSRTASLDLRHSRNSSADLNKYIKNDIGLVFGQIQQNQNWINDPMRVQIIKAHQNWISVAYTHFVICYRMKDSCGWQLIFTSPYIEQPIERIAINAKMNLSNSDTHSKMVAASYGSQIRLWGISEDGSKTEVGTFNLHLRVEYLFFIGNQLVALNSSGKIGVWQHLNQHWQIQDLLPILSFDYAGSFLLLGCNNGSIYYIGEYFPSNFKILKWRGNV